METVTSADGTVIAFDQIGQGPPIVLVASASCDRSVDTPTAGGAPWGISPKHATHAN
jgi:hypothetical protein